LFKKKLDDYVIAAFECARLKIAFKIKKIFPNRGLFQLEIVVNVVRVNHFTSLYVIYVGHFKSSAHCTFSL
jgi:hypothetical protein